MSLTENSNQLFLPGGAINLQNSPYISVWPLHYKPKFTFRLLKKGIQEFHGSLFWPPQIRLLTMLWSFEKDTILTP